MTTEHTPDNPAPFGDLDGEIIDAIGLRVTGGGGLKRLPLAGEELTLIVTATVTDTVKIERTAGLLIRTHAAKVIELAEAPEGSDIAEDALSYLAGYRGTLDELRGVTQLPLDEVDDTTAGVADGEAGPEPDEDDDGAQ